MAAPLALVRAGPGADFAAILALIRRSFAYMEGRIDPPSSMLRLTEASIAEHARTHEVWQALDGTAPAACMFLTIEPERLYLGKLAVDEDWRGRGLARALVERACERAVALGLPAVELKCRIELVENHRAFAAMGFTTIAETAHPGYDRPTSLTMRREAPPPR